MRYDGGRRSVKSDIAVKTKSLIHKEIVQIVKIRRIGKITLDGYFNYGNVLQNYALQQMLLHYADSVETIWHEADNFLPRTGVHWTWKDPIKYILNWRNYRQKYIKDYLGHTLGMEMVRQGKLKDWSDRYIHTRTGVQDLRTIA